MDSRKFAILLVGVAIVLGITSVVVIAILVYEEDAPEIKPLPLAEETAIETIDPLNDEQYRAVIIVVQDQLMVFDFGEYHESLSEEIQAKISSGDDYEKAKRIATAIVDEHMDRVKERIIRETLVDVYGQYLEEDVEYIGMRTSNERIKKLIVAFELEYMDIEQ